MMELFGYFSKVTICLLVFGSIYYVCLRQLTFFWLSRLYIIVSLMCSFAIPLITLEVRKYELAEAPASVKESRIQPTNFPEEIEETSGRSVRTVTWLQVLGYMYFLVSFILFARLLIQVTLMFKSVKKNMQRLDGIFVTSPVKGLSNCSFFNIAFIGKEGLSASEFEQILAHEKVHISRLHSIDKLLIELACIVMWFNPLIYYYRYVLTMIHEFEVDSVMASKFEKRNYATMLLKFSAGQSFAGANSFSRNDLEVRIQMLFTHKSTKMKKLFYLSLIPAVLGLGLYLSVQVVYAKVYKNTPTETKGGMPVHTDADNKSGSVHSPDEIPLIADDEKDAVNSARLIPSVPKEVRTELIPEVKTKSVLSAGEINTSRSIIPGDPRKKVLKVVLDPGHGGKDDNIKAGGIYEKDLNLEVALEIRKVLQAKGYEVIMTRETDEFVPLHTRASVQGDIFVSIHTNQMLPGQEEKDGMEIFISQTMAQSPDLLSRSADLARVFYRELNNLDGIDVNENIKQQSLAVLRANHAPAILVELGFMTSEKDLKFITNNSNQVRIGHAFADAIANYK